MEVPDAGVAYCLNMKENQTTCVGCRLRLSLRSCLWDRVVRLCFGPLLIGSGPDSHPHPRLVLACQPPSPTPLPTYSQPTPTHSPDRWTNQLSAEDEAYYAHQGVFFPTYLSSVFPCVCVST